MPQNINTIIFIEATTFIMKKTEAIQMSTEKMEVWIKTYSHSYRKNYN